MSYTAQQQTAELFQSMLVAAEETILTGKPLDLLDNIGILGDDDDGWGSVCDEAQAIWDEEGE